MISRDSSVKQILIETLPPSLAVLDAGDEAVKKTEIYGLWSVHSEEGAYRQKDQQRKEGRGKKKGRKKEREKRGKREIKNERKKKRQKDKERKEKRKTGRNKDRKMKKIYIYKRKQMVCHKVVSSVEKKQAEK